MMMLPLSGMSSLIVRVGVASLLLGTTACANGARSQAEGFDPRRPRAAGYRLVVDEQFDAPERVDVDGEGPRTTWFRQQFFGWKPTPVGSVRLVRGVLELGGGERGGALLSARPEQDQPGWRGRVFGGGFYVEARIALGPKMEEKGWPAFWSMAVEHMAPGGAAQVPGMPDGYEHFAENDFFEPITEYVGPDTYGTALHDWWGQLRTTCLKRAFCGVTNNQLGARGHVAHAPEGTDWTHFHTIAQRWVPATATRAGFVQNYFDGTPTSRTQWQRWNAGAPLPPSGDRQFGIMDRQRLVIIMQGSRRVMRVDWLRVWQLAGVTAEVRASSVRGN